MHPLSTRTHASNPRHPTLPRCHPHHNSRKQRCHDATTAYLPTWSRRLRSTLPHNPNFHRTELPVSINGATKEYSPRSLSSPTFPLPSVVTRLARCIDILHTLNDSESVFLCNMSFPLFNTAALTLPIRGEDTLSSGITAGVYILAGMYVETDT